MQNTRDFFFILRSLATTVQVLPRLSIRLSSVFFFSITAKMTVRIHRKGKGEANLGRINKTRMLARQEPSHLVQHLASARPQQYKLITILTADPLQKRCYTIFKFLLLLIIKTNPQSKSFYSLLINTQYLNFITCNN